MRYWLTSCALWLAVAATCSAPADAQRDDGGPIVLVGTRIANQEIRRYVGSGALPSDTEMQEVQEKEEEEEEEKSCTSHSMDDFPEDLFTYEQRVQGAAALHAFFCFYCFLLTAFVCNDYLLPALDCICADMNISADVAGATFLATASCFPELFVNVVGTFLTESDLGVGTVVGSAVFNTFATPACGALSAVHGIQLEWRILSRDCVIYVISVGTLVLVMWDGLVTWYEAAILMALFAGYLTLLFCSRTISRWYNKITHLCSKKKIALEETESGSKTHDLMPHGLYRPYFHGELVAEYRKSMSKRASAIAAAKDAEQQNGTADADDVDEYVEPDSPFVVPEGSPITKAWFLFTWPLRIVLFVTIPDSRYKRLRKWYPATFVMCVIWIAISSYLVSWMTTVVGDTIGIADSVMGITFLAAGGNMPEMVSIVILSRQGNGDMAMSNTLGANTLDILLCLGLPWTIKTLMSGKDVQIVSGALSYSVLSIVVCVIGFYSVTAYYKFKLNKKVGCVCLLMYAVFLVFSILVELNVFFHVNWPMCEK